MQSKKSKSYEDVLTQQATHTRSETPSDDNTFVNEVEDIEFEQIEVEQIENNNVPNLNDIQKQFHMTMTKTILSFHAKSNFSREDVRFIQAKIKDVTHFFLKL